ncbi:MAG: nopaline dehydrogenase, partial [Proteobacteria bacterium]
SSPASSTNRYITEDAAYLLVPCYHFARLLGIEVPVITSCLHIDNACNDTNYFETGRTLEKMGLAGLSVEQIIASVA